jgi:hypothetical protein
MATSQQRSSLFKTATPLSLIAGVDSWEVSDHPYLRLTTATIAPKVSLRHHSTVPNVSTLSVQSAGSATGKHALDVPLNITSLQLTVLPPPTNISCNLKKSLPDGASPKDLKLLHLKHQHRQAALQPCLRRCQFRCLAKQPQRNVADHQQTLQPLLN